VSVTGSVSRTYEGRGDNEFPNFIGFISNPTLNLDPRALTQLWPVFSSTWASALPPVPGGDFQAYGAGISVALSERFEFGLNRGAYVEASFGAPTFRRFPGLAQALNLQGGEREGWLDLGGFVQYTLIRDVPNQFIFSVGLQAVAPSGSKDLFQGTGPAVLAPYFTTGKECGPYHVLLTGGYQFPAESDPGTPKSFFGGLHLDRRVCCWFYPVLEFNGFYWEKQIDLSLSTRRGFFDLGAPEAAGNMLEVAPGFNLVLVLFDATGGSTPVAS
jgi:hypothetical protein